MEFDQRYSLIKEGSRPEEIVLLQGKGCFWKKCNFCDYYTDVSDLDESTALNKAVLERVTGETGRLTVINSGSFFELPKATINQVYDLLEDKRIKDLSIESHLFYLSKVRDLRERLTTMGVDLHARSGIETFDEDFRENVLNKGFGKIDVKEVAQVFDECCLLFGIEGQSLEQLKKDLEIAQENFKDIYLNIYTKRKNLEEDPKLVKEFMRELYPEIKENKKIHILLKNTDLGVGD